jgi:hypothetical protein
VALVVLGLAASVGCGKKGLPKPPQWVRPKPVLGLKIIQRGDDVVVALTPPRSRTDGSPFEQDVVLRVTLLSEAGPKVSKQGGKHQRSPAPGERPGSVSWIVPQKDWPSYAVGSRLEIPIKLSSLELPEPRGATTFAGRKVTFIVEVQEGRHWRSLVAGPALTTLCDPPPPPTAVEARPAPAGILVWWNLPPSSPQLVQVYRAQSGTDFGEHPWRSLPPGTTSSLDETAVPGTEYRYQIRMGRAEDPNRCESAATGDAAAVGIDLFPPARPLGLAAAAEESLLRLFWTPGPEPDIAGYLVYRSDGPDEPFRLLTPVPIPATTYADTDVRRGVRYTYVVSAVDTAQPPNESGWSEPAEEALP